MYFCFSCLSDAAAYFAELEASRFAVDARGRYEPAEHGDGHDIAIAESDITCLSMFFE